MRFIFGLLLLTFSIIGAYVTFLFTSSLATTAASAVAFAALGIAFDTLKCTLPAALFDFLEQRRYTYAAICAIVCSLLIAFSLYASFHLFDGTAGEKNKISLAYELKRQQIAALEQQREILFRHDKATVSAPVTAKIEALQQELLAMPAPKTSTKEIELAANLALSLLLELSVFSCHIALRRTRQNSSASHAKKSTEKRTRSLAHTGLDDSSKSAEKRARSALKALSVDELARVISERGDVHLTYRELEKKYGLSSGKVKQVKELLATPASHLSIVQ